MSDEQIGQPEFALQILQQVDDLCLYRDVQRAHRFVTHHEPGPQRKRAGDPDALALAAGEFVWEPVGTRDGRPTSCSMAATVVRVLAPTLAP